MGGHTAIAHDAKCMHFTARGGPEVRENALKACGDECRILVEDGAGCEKSALAEIRNDVHQVLERGKEILDGPDGEKLKKDVEKFKGAEGKAKAEAKAAVMQDVQDIKKQMLQSEEVEKLRSDVKSAALEVKDDVERMIISKGKGKGSRIAEALVHVGENLEHVGTTKGGRVGEVVGVFGSVIAHIGAEVEDKLKN